MPDTDVRMLAELDRLEHGEDLNPWTDGAWLDDAGELSATPGWWWTLCH
jgi:hypothetical protein